MRGRGEVLSQSRHERASIVTRESCEVEIEATEVLVELRRQVYALEKGLVPPETAVELLEKQWARITAHYDQPTLKKVQQFVETETRFVTGERGEKIEQSLEKLDTDSTIVNLAEARTWINDLEQKTRQVAELLPHREPLARAIRERLQILLGQKKVDFVAADILHATAHTFTGIIEVSRSVFRRLGGQTESSAAFFLQDSPWVILNCNDKPKQKSAAASHEIIHNVMDRLVPTDLPSFQLGRRFKRIEQALEGGATAKAATLLKDIEPELIVDLLHGELIVITEQAFDGVIHRFGTAQDEISIVNTQFLQLSDRFIQAGQPELAQKANRLRQATNGHYKKVCMVVRRMLGIAAHLEPKAEAIEKVQVLFLSKLPSQFEDIYNFLKFEYGDAAVARAEKQLVRS